MEAYGEREKREWQRTAWLAAAILTGFSGKRVSPRRLLPEVFEETKLVTKEEAKRELEDLKRKLRIQ